MEVLDKILQDQLKELENTGTVSVNKIVNLESAVVDLDPSLEGFITKDIPLNKFSVSETTTNLEEVKLRIQSLINLRSDIALANEINKHSIDNVLHKLKEFIHFVTVLQSFIGSCKDIDPVILEGFRHFKFNTVKRYDTDDGGTKIGFHNINDNVPFIQALIETDLKEVFCPNGIPANIERLRADATETEKSLLRETDYGTYANDSLAGVIFKLIGLAELNKDQLQNPSFVIDILLGRDPEQLSADGENVPGFYLTYGYSITLNDICRIADTGKETIEALEKVKQELNRYYNNLFGPEYIVYALRSPKPKVNKHSISGPFSSFRPDIMNAILDGNWRYEDKMIHMQENHEPLNESFIIIREAFGKNYEH